MAAVDWLPASCEARQTVGMHRYPGDVDAGYLPSVFTEQTFDLRENVFFMRHLLGDQTAPDGSAGGDASATVQLYVTMSSDGVETEFECRPVRGILGNEGYSCVNNPPSEMLLINPVRGRFTRSAIGGWAFYAPEASLFVEYGTCAMPTRKSASE